MKMLFLSVLILSCVGCESIPDAKYCESYVKVGAGYIVDQTAIRWDDGKGERSPISARFELGCEYNNISYGLSHHSQWLEGFPFNNNDEPQKTEAFIDYKFN